VSYKKRVYHTIENGNVTVSCTANCSSNTANYIGWHIQIPFYNEFRLFAITDGLQSDIENNFGIEIEHNAHGNECSGVNTYELELIGVGVNMSHSVVECGISNSGNVFLAGGVYIIVDRIGEAVGCSSQAGIY